MSVGGCIVENSWLQNAATVDQSKTPGSTAGSSSFFDHRCLLPASAPSGHRSRAMSGSCRLRRPLRGGIPGLQTVPPRRLAWVSGMECACDVVARAIRLIADGTVGRTSGVSGLAVARLHHSPAGRLLQAVVGAGRRVNTPDAYQTPVLIGTTNLPFGDVTFAAGFSNRFQRHRSPGVRRHTTALRARAAARFGSATASAGTVSLPRPCTIRTEGVFGHLATTRSAGLRRGPRWCAYRRTLRSHGATASSA